MQKNRFYYNNYPDINDMVVCKVNNITDNGIYVELLEYNKKQALISYNEVSSRRIKSVRSVLKEGSIDAFCVINVDENKGYIDLTNKNIRADEKETAFKVFRKNKIISNIIYSFIITNNIKDENVINQLYYNLLWKFTENNKNYENAYLYYKNVKRDNNIFDLIINDEYKDNYIALINKVIPNNIFKIILDIKLYSLDFNGIETTKNILLDAIKYSKQNDKDMYIDITIIKSPMYRLSCITDNEDNGNSLINKICDILKNNKCTFEIVNKTSTEKID